MSALERWRLANGLTVLYRRDAAFPLASGTLLLRTGSRYETPREAGLCSMTIDLLQQGTRSRDARRLAHSLESVGASLGTQAHEDYTELGFVVPGAEMDRVLDVAAEILEEPSFPHDEIRKEKAHVAASLHSRRDAIFTFAHDLVNAMMYGDHPYGRPLEGRLETVRTFKRSHFQRWHAARLDPASGILSCVAPFSGRDMLRRLEKTIGRWRRGGAKQPGVLPAAFRPLKRSLKRVEKSSFEQAYLMTGWQAPSVGDPDQIPLKVLNTLMGGGMSSRLFVTLREKLGLAYEVSSFATLRQDFGQWVIYLGLPKEKLKTAARQLEDMLNDLKRRGPALGEVRQAQAMIRGAFLMDSQSRRRRAWYQAWWELLGRHERYGEEFLKRIDAVSVPDVTRVAREILARPRATVAVVPK